MVSGVWWGLVVMVAVVVMVLVIVVLDDVGVFG